MIYISILAPVNDDNVITTKEDKYMGLGLGWNLEQVS